MLTSEIKLGSFTLILYTKKSQLVLTARRFGHQGGNAHEKPVGLVMAGDMIDKRGPPTREIKDKLKEKENENKQRSMPVTDGQE